MSKDNPDDETKKRVEIITDLFKELRGTRFPGWEFWTVVVHGGYSPIDVKRWSPAQVLDAFQLLEIRTLFPR